MYNSGRGGGRGGGYGGRGGGYGGRGGGYGGRGGGGYGGHQQRFSHSQSRHQDGGAEYSHSQRAQRLASSHTRSGYARHQRQLIKHYTVNHYASIAQHLEDRVVQPADDVPPTPQPHLGYIPYMRPPAEISRNPANVITRDCIRRLKPKGEATNSIAWCCSWTPDGRRLISGHSSGHILMWFTSTFHFETIVEVGRGIRSLKWNRDGTWMLTGDDEGCIKYWQVTIKNVCEFQPHKNSVRQIDFSPTSNKFCTCSDDSTVRVFDFETFNEDRVLRGHGADVRTVGWHPTLSLIASGSHDTQQPLKLWDPRMGENLATLYNVHRDSVTDVKWNDNGNWLLTASRDSLIKLFDIRMMKDVHTYRAHPKAVMSLAWHPLYEDMFVSGGTDGEINFWLQGTEEPIATMEDAHDSHVLQLSWHPLGHALSSSSNDQSIKCWSRNIPGDDMTLNAIGENMRTVDSNAHIQERIQALSQEPPDHEAPASSSAHQYGTAPTAQASSALPGLNDTLPSAEPSSTARATTSLPGLG